VFLLHRVGGLDEVFICLELKLFEHIGNFNVSRAAFDNGPFFFMKGLYAKSAAVFGLDLIETLTEGPSVQKRLFQVYRCADPVL
jgi:hypothetical protein